MIRSRRNQKPQKTVVKCIMINDKLVTKMRSSPNSGNEEQNIICKRMSYKNITFYDVGVCILYMIHLTEEDS